MGTEICSAMMITDKPKSEKQVSLFLNHPMDGRAIKSTWVKRGVDVVSCFVATLENNHITNTFRNIHLVLLCADRRDTTKTAYFF